MAQQRVALMCGPGPGAPVGVQKEGCVFVPLYLCTGSRSRAHDHTKQTREVSQGKTEAQDNQSNAKAKTTKSRGAKQVPPARPLPGGLRGPGKTLVGTARPTPTERATLEPTAPNAVINMGPGLGKAPLWWHADLCEDIFKIR